MSLSSFHQECDLKGSDIYNFINNKTIKYIISLLHNQQKSTIANLSYPCDLRETFNISVKLKRDDK